MTLTEKTAYIKGLVEGLELNADEKEVKVINAIIGLLDDMALTVSDLEESMNDMGNQLDEVDEDLYYLSRTSTMRMKMTARMRNIMRSPVPPVMKLSAFPRMFC